MITSEYSTGNKMQDPTSPTKAAAIYDKIYFLGADSEAHCGEENR